MTTAPPSPIVAPTDARTKLSRRTAPSTVRACAPSAIRIPISRVRVATLKAASPYTPMAARPRLLMKRGARGGLPRRATGGSLVQLQHLGFAVPDELPDDEDDPPREYPPGDALPLPEEDPLLVDGE